MLTKTRLRKKVAPLSRVLQAIAHPIRLSILHLVARYELESWQLAEAIDISQSLLFHHLNEMRRAGWIHKEKYGKKAYYKLEKSMIPTFQKLFSHIIVDE